MRFGHDGNIIPLLTLLKIQNTFSSETDPSKVYQTWNAYSVSPMAANLQLIFFKNKQQRILVKFLHNEREVSVPVSTSTFPYYEWNDIKEYFTNILKERFENL